MNTNYRGPSEMATLKIGGGVIRLVRPAEPDQLLDEGEVHDLNRSDDYMPYWAYLWPGAYLLAEVVARHRWSGETALEIGCGLGLAGMVGLTRGLKVHFTDYDAAPLEFVSRSATENGFDSSHFTTGLIDWRDPPDGTFPLILAADVLYERRLVPLVANVLAKMLAPCGEAWIADPYRAAAEVFPSAAAARGLECVMENVESHSEGLGTIRGTLHRVTRAEG